MYFSHGQVMLKFFMSELNFYLSWTIGHKFGTPCSIIPLTKTFKPRAYVAVYDYPLTYCAWVWLHLPLPASKPNNMNPPNVITAASLLFQSGFLMFSLMNDKTWGTMWCSVHWASSIRQTPPALQGFQSSSSSNSSCKW